MIKDRAQKASALRYIVAKRWFPQLEIDVLPKIATTTKNKLITDIDVLGSVPDEFFGYRAFLFDCKSGRESPINRTLWLRGLMDRVHATRGLLILTDKKNIERDHRLSAAALNISIVKEGEFGILANATDGHLQVGVSRVAELDNWEIFFSIPEKFPKLEEMVTFSRSAFWMCDSPAEACRKTIAILRKARPELDPANALHTALFGDFVALFLHSLARLSLQIFMSYLQPSNRDDLADALLLLLYGGRDSYELANQLRKLVPTDKQNGGEEKELTPPEWNKFVQLTRHILEAPRQALFAPLLAREVAWGYLNDDKDSIEFARLMAVEQPQSGKFCLLAAEYLGKAAKVPPEFAQKYSKQFLQIQSKNYKDI
jgi:hypothetical protein